MDTAKNRKGNLTKQRINGTVGKTLENKEWPEHITELDIRGINIGQLEESIKFPPNLVVFDMSHNVLTDVPGAVYDLDKLKSLNLSFNKIKYFDDKPNFCHTIEILNVSHNNLCAPPYWIWAYAPEKLKEVDLSFNHSITASLDINYLEELLQYKTCVRLIKINNCHITKHYKLFSTLSKVTVMEIGSDNLNNDVNRVCEVPREGLDNCCDIEKLRLTNTYLYTIKCSIDMFTKLTEIDFSNNYVSSLPDEFCNLHNLQVCKLSMNQLLYLPERIGELKKLTSLHIDSNELCILPHSIIELENLLKLDLYNNCLWDINSTLIRQCNEIDLAQNYLEESDDQVYLESRERLRLNVPERFNGRKILKERTDDECFSSESMEDDEEFESRIINGGVIPENNDRASSPEDWDSDEYWVPRYCKRNTAPAAAPWLFFVKKKMEEGNFCPMDAHQVSVMEKVRYEKYHSPSVLHESDGQFDDYSDDNS